MKTRLDALWVRFARVFVLASASIVIGSTGYVTFAANGGRTCHEHNPQDPLLRTTHVGFATWKSIVPVPDFSELAFQERLGTDGVWRKDGFFLRRTRSGYQIEEGTYRNGQREGVWTFWDANRGYERRFETYESDLRCP